MKNPLIIDNWYNFQVKSKKKRYDRSSFFVSLAHRQYKGNGCKKVLLISQFIYFFNWCTQFRVNEHATHEHILKSYLLKPMHPPQNKMSTYFICLI